MEELVTVILAVFDEAPIPKKPPEPLTLTVIALSEDILFEFALFTVTSTFSTGTCAIAAIGKNASSMIASRVQSIFFIVFWFSFFIFFPFLLQREEAPVVCGGISCRLRHCFRRFNSFSIAS
ncbi:MAG: hypothetical protein IJP33_00050 [Firmicutes bacterium]|nr:hypothetical protein [Bacillota bacterium]